MTFCINSKKSPYFTKFEHLFWPYLKKIFVIEKIKMCHPEEINKDYDAKNNWKKKGLLKDIMHNY